MSRRRGLGPPTLRSASVTRSSRWWLCPAGDRRSLHRSGCDRCGHGAGARPPAARSERDEQVSDLVGARPLAAQHDGAVDGERRRGHGAPCGDVVGSNTFSLRADSGSACAGRRLLADPVALRAWLIVVIDPLGEPGRTDAIAARVAVERTPDRHAGRGRAHRRARHARGADDPRATPHRRPRATARTQRQHARAHAPAGQRARRPGRRRPARALASGVGRGAARAMVDLGRLSRPMRDGPCAFVGRPETDAFDAGCPSWPNARGHGMVGRIAPSIPSSHRITLSLLTAARRSPPRRPA